MYVRELDLCGSLKEANVAELSTVIDNITSIVNGQYTQVLIKVGIVL